jgi:hypothetical protein
MMKTGIRTLSMALACALLWGCASADTPPPAPAAAANPHPASEATIDQFPGMACEQLDGVMEALYLTAADFDNELKKDPEAYKKTTKKSAAPAISPITTKFKVAEKEYKSRCKGAATQYAAAKKAQPTKIWPY